MDLLLDRILEWENDLGELYIIQDNDGKTYIRIIGEMEAYCLDYVFSEAILRGPYKKDEPALLFEIKREDGLTYLTFSQESNGGTDEDQISLFFDDVRVEVVPCDYTRTKCCRESMYNPWQVIAEYVYSVHVKITACGEEWANEKEKMLAELEGFRPLMYQIAHEGLAENAQRGTERFLSYIEAVREEGCPVLEKLEQTVRCYYQEQDEKERRSLQGKIAMLLLKKEIRPLFVHIFEEFKEAASEYPTCVEANVEREEIDPVRNEIHEAIISRGFTGEYPNYYKAGEIKGLHIVKGIKETQTVWNEKEVGMYLKVIERMGFAGKDSEGESLYLQVTFEGARTFLRKKAAAEVTDHRIEAAYYEPGELSIVHHEGVIFTKTSEEGEVFSFTAEKLVNYIVKKIECKKIKKEETENVVVQKSFYIPKGLDLLIYGVVGIMFSALMCIAFILMDTFIVLVGQQGMGAVKDVLTEFPWSKMFWGMAVAFWGLSYLASKRAK